MPFSPWPKTSCSASLMPLSSACLEVVGDRAAPVRTLQPLFNLKMWPNLSTLGQWMEWGTHCARNCKCLSLGQTHGFCVPPISQSFIRSEQPNLRTAINAPVWIGYVLLLYVRPRQGWALPIWPIPLLFPPFLFPFCTPPWAKGKGNVRWFDGGWQPMPFWFCWFRA